MCGITREYVFNKPFLDGGSDASNRALADEELLAAAQTSVWGDAEVLARIAATRDGVFAGKKECLVHGDLHTGSVMAFVPKKTEARKKETEDGKDDGGGGEGEEGEDGSESLVRVKVIDAEFAFYGAAGMDLGLFFAGYETPTEKKNIEET